MKRLLLIAFLMVQAGLYAQKDCEFSSNFKDSIGTYKETKQKIIYEKVFAGSSSNIFFSLINADGTPVLNFQNIQKSKDFIKATCFDSTSKIYLQLENGKIIERGSHNELLEQKGTYYQLYTGAFELE